MQEVKCYHCGNKTCLDVTLYKLSFCCNCRKNKVVRIRYGIPDNAEKCGDCEGEN